MHQTNNWQQLPAPAIQGFWGLYPGIPKKRCNNQIPPHLLTRQIIDGSSLDVYQYGDEKYKINGETHYTQISKKVMIYIMSEWILLYVRTNIFLCQKYFYTMWEQYPNNINIQLFFLITLAHTMWLYSPSHCPVCPFHCCQQPRPSKDWPLNSRWTGWIAPHPGSGREFRRLALAHPATQDLPCRMLKSRRKGQNPVAGLRLSSSRNRWSLPQVMAKW